MLQFIREPLNPEGHFISGWMILTLVMINYDMWSLRRGRGTSSLVLRPPSGVRAAMHQALGGDSWEVR